MKRLINYKQVWALGLCLLLGQNGFAGAPSNNDIADIVAPIATLLGLSVVVGGVALYQRLSYKAGQYKIGKLVASDPFAVAVDAIATDNTGQELITYLQADDVANVKNILKANPNTQNALKGEYYDSAQSVLQINNNGDLFQALVNGNMVETSLGSPVDAWVNSFNEVATKIANCLVASVRNGVLTTTGDAILEQANAKATSGSVSEILDQIDTMTQQFAVQAGPVEPVNGPVKNGPKTNSGQTIYEQLQKEMAAGSLTIEQAQANYASIQSNISNLERQITVAKEQGAATDELEAELSEQQATAKAYEGVIEDNPVDVDPVGP